MQRIERTHGPIGEAVNHFQTQPRIVEQTEDAPAALGPKIEGEELLVGHRKAIGDPHSAIGHRPRPIRTPGETAASMIVFLAKRAYRFHAVASTVGG